MKFLLLILSLMTISFKTIAEEYICEPYNSAGPYSTLRIQTLLIPMNNEYKNKHLFNISNKLIDYLKEQCKTKATSQEIIGNMGFKCKSLAKEIVNKEDLQGYLDNCDLGYLQAMANYHGAKSQMEKCEKKDAITDLSRAAQKLIPATDVKTTPDPNQANPK